MPYPDVCPDCDATLSPTTSCIAQSDGTVRLRCPVCGYQETFETEPSSV